MDIDIVKIPYVNLQTSTSCKSNLGLEYRNGIIEHVKEYEYFGTTITNDENQRYIVR